MSERTGSVKQKRPRKENWTEADVLLLKSEVEQIKLNRPSENLSLTLNDWSEIAGKINTFNPKTERSPHEVRIKWRDLKCAKRKGRSIRKTEPAQTKVPKQVKKQKQKQELLLGQVQQKKKKPRKENWTSEEVQLLKSEIEQWKLNGLGENEKLTLTQNDWSEISRKINLINGETERTPAEVRVKWRDLKFAKRRGRFVRKTEPDQAIVPKPLLKKREHVLRVQQQKNKRPRKENWTSEEVQLLKSEVEQRKLSQLSEKPTLTPNDWSEIAGKINLINGETERTPGEVRIKWRDLKFARGRSKYRRYKELNLAITDHLEQDIPVIITICNKCVICNADVRPDNENVTKIFPEGESQSTNELLLHNFCHHFRISYPLLASINPEKVVPEYPPFCSVCAQEVENLLELDEKLEMLKREISLKENWVKSQIKHISTTNEDANGNCNVKIWKSQDRRVEAIRDIVVGPELRLEKVAVDIRPLNQDEPSQFEDLLTDFTSFTEISGGGDVGDDIPNLNLSVEDDWEFHDNLYFEAESVDVKPGDHSVEVTSEVNGNADSTKVQVKVAKRNRQAIEQLEEDRYLYRGKLEFTGNEKDGFRCSECLTDWVFKTKNAIICHFKNHLEKPAGTKCPICGKVLVSPNGLQNHIESHDESFIAICEICGKSCKSSAALKYHKSYNHRQERQECEICGKRYKGKSNMRVHMRRVHLKTKNYYCELCGKGFYSKVGLKDHSFTAAHSDVKPYSCDICGVGLRQKQFIARHKRRFHSQPKDPKDKDAAPPFELSAKGSHSNRPSLACSVCGLQYSRINHLIRHLKEIHHINEEDATAELHIEYSEQM